MIATTKANVFNIIGFILEKVRANSQIRFGYDVICLSLFVTKLDSCKEVPVTERKRLILPCYVLNAKKNIQYYSNSQTRLLQEKVLLAGILLASMCISFSKNHTTFSPATYNQRVS
jgi:hypothetical protein